MVQNLLEKGEFFSSLRENLPALYEMRGTLQVVEAVTSAAAAHGYETTTQRLVRRAYGGFFVRVLADGKPAVEMVHRASGARVHVIPQRSYGTCGELTSSSFSQKPDVSVVLSAAHGTRSVYLFDPKYKLDSEFIEADSMDGRPKKVDIDKMHAYRDAIRDASGARVVKFAATLYPGRSERFGTGIAALRDYPGEHPTAAEQIGRIMDAPLAAYACTPSEPGEVAE